jgi:hypothetical protein
MEEINSRKKKKYLWSQKKVPKEFTVLYVRVLCIEETFEASPCCMYCEGLIIYHPSLC